MLTRCLFALLALAALVTLFLPEVIPESDARLRKLLLAGIGFLGTGMVVPWGRWVPFVSPRSNLGFVTKLIGWGGASGLPFCLVTEAWLAAGVCALLPLSAFALWRGRAWAAWPWYAVAVGAFGLSITIAIEIFVRGGISDLGLLHLVPLIWILFWSGIGLVLAREITPWRRGLQSQSAAPPSRAAC